MDNILNYEFFRWGDYSLNVYNIVIVVIILFATKLVLFLLKRVINRTTKIEKGKKYSIYQIISYFIWILAIAFSLESLNIRLTILLAGSAALLVGVGLGLQQTFNDFISGFIVLVEGTVKIGDVIEVDGLVAKVTEIGIRTTKVLTRDDKMIILPNSVLTNNKLQNWSHSFEKSRFEINVGVAYGSDLVLVKKILSECAEEHPDVHSDPKPFVRFFDFGNSSLDFNLIFWSENIFRIENIKSDIRFRIDEEFRKNGVTIPFPQRDVHIFNPKT